MRTIFGASGINNAFCSIFNSSFALAVVFLLRSLRSVPNPEPDFREKVKEIGVIRIEDIVSELMIGVPDVV
jgi:hypothetical protein